METVHKVKHVSFGYLYRGIMIYREIFTKYGDPGRYVIKESIAEGAYPSVKLAVQSIETALIPETVTYKIASEIEIQHTIRLPIYFATLQDNYEASRNRYTFSKRFRLIFQEVETGKIATRFIYSNTAYDIYLVEPKEVLQKELMFGRLQEKCFEDIIGCVLFRSCHIMSHTGPQEFDFNLDRRNDILRRRKLAFMGVTDVVAI